MKADQSPSGAIPHRAFAPTTHSGLSFPFVGWTTYGKWTSAGLILAKKKPRVR